MSRRTRSRRKLRAIDVFWSCVLLGCLAWAVGAAEWLVGALVIGAMVLFGITAVRG